VRMSFGFICCSSLAIWEADGSCHKKPMNQPIADIACNDDDFFK